MIKSFWRNLQAPLTTLLAALILYALVGGPTALLCWGFSSAPEKVQYLICIGLLVLFIVVVVGVKFCRRVWREAKEDYEWHNSHSFDD